jgi:hypothetical protein
MIKNWCAAPFDCAEIGGYGRLIWAPAESKRRRPLIDLFRAQWLWILFAGQQVATKWLRRGSQIDASESARLRIRLFALAAAQTLWLVPFTGSLKSWHKRLLLTPAFRLQECVHLPTGNIDFSKWTYFQFLCEDFLIYLVHNPPIRKIKGSFWQCLEVFKQPLVQNQLCLAADPKIYFCHLVRGQSIFIQR